MNIGELTLDQINEIKAMNVMTQSTNGDCEFLRYIGKRPTFYAMNYIYTGTVVEVVGGSILLDNALIIYDTGSHTSPDWDKAEPMPNGWAVCIQAIESHGIFK
jgi:hypothetical protein